ncbi:hypothetical protein I5907_21500 [Panacibacter sp. DH6]|uniref:Uncharacterized protein n=1 Tax=Panacibacter microcysteis TaxID=2793269 RepID=A0A931H0M6_9BACT|nr:hypothetical protein [Panacibacter microcysteis]MBG9378823.1 hypothetical protein [Panacibacter microcysteis]
MKHLTTAILIFLTMFAKGQDIKVLQEVNSGDSVQVGTAIIYGNFIQRLGFSSGGFPQDIRLINIDTQEVLTFRVKPTFKSAKENTFIYFIKPGNYAILNYWWTQSKWYGGKMFTEPIFRGIDATDDFEQKVKSGQIKTDELKPFYITIKENSLNYVGTWHFDKGLVSFSDDKLQFDDLVKSKFQKLDFSNAITTLPR